MGNRRHALLTAAGYNVETVHTAADAVRLLERDSYDIVIAGQMLTHREKIRLIDCARQQGVPTLAIHVLPSDETSHADEYVRISDGAEGLLLKITQLTTARKCRARCRPSQGRLT